MATNSKKSWNEVHSAIAHAATDYRPVAGLTHNFYRYPARFAPGFAATAIQQLSTPTDLVLDPYMGGGTTVVEAVAAGRSVVGNDLNSLAAFITRVKITPLKPNEIAALKSWASNDVPSFKYQLANAELVPFIDDQKTKNLNLVRARFIKKVVAAALASLESLPTEATVEFAKCVVLRVGQWALDGRERHTSLTDFRTKLADTTIDMINAMNGFEAASCRRAVILNMDASRIDEAPVFCNGTTKANLVVTSPPYPGVHVLYHRWQVDGRRETPAPYWIAGCHDGNGASFYNFADRRQGAAENYFKSSLATLSAIRRVVAEGSYFVQMLAFNKPDEQLPRYLSNMSEAGFSEVRYGKARIWRSVPNRKWHATFKGDIASANEVVLIHQAV